MSERKVNVFRYALKESGQYDRLEGGGFKRDLVGSGIFHEFGFDYEDTDAGPGNFSVALVEWPDGIVEKVPVELIKFVK